MDFSEILKAKRKEAALTQEQLAEKSGMSLGAIRNLEQGIRPDPQWSTVQMLARGLGIKPDELANLPEVPDPPPVEGKKKRKEK